MDRILRLAAGSFPVRPSVTDSNSGTKYRSELADWLKDAVGEQVTVPWPLTGKKRVPATVRKVDELEDGKVGVSISKGGQEVDVPVWAVGPPATAAAPEKGKRPKPPANGTFSLKSVPANSLDAIEAWLKSGKWLSCSGIDTRYAGVPFYCQFDRDNYAAHGIQLIKPQEKGYSVAAGSKRTYMMPGQLSFVVEH